MVTVDGSMRPLEDISHFLMLDKPAEFNETLLAFLKKNDLLKN